MRFKEMIQKEKWLSPVNKKDNAYLAQTQSKYPLFC
jgi:hypothetical protein